ncbi:MAG: response regulator [Solirubrobacteraceae bacterium]
MTATSRRIRLDRDMSMDGLPGGALSGSLDAAADGIVLVGADGRIRDVNRAALELFGYERNELVGVVIERLVPGRLRRRHVNHRTAYAENPRPRPMGLALRLQGLRRDGSEVPVEISLAPMDEGPSRSIVAIVRDATEQRNLRGVITDISQQPSAGEPAAEAADARRATLLLVEDEPALRTLVVTMLEEQGYAVLHAGNGLDAIAVAERHVGAIDLLVTDVVMPRLSGPELARQLQTLRPGLEVLFMSGYDDSRLVNRGVQKTNVNLLVKPFTPDQLIDRVAELTEPARR